MEAFVFPVGCPKMSLLFENSKLVCSIVTDVKMVNMAYFKSKLNIDDNYAPLICKF